MSEEKKQIGAAIVGCGNISTSYAENMLKYPELKLLGFNDIDASRSEECVYKYGGKVYASLDEVLDDSEVEIVVNLTIFQVHAEVIRKCLEAGKNVHTEKPISMTSEESWSLVKLAEEKGLLLSSSPVTFMGEAQDAAWSVIQSGKLGEVRLAYAEVNHGLIEDWHPNPGPFYDLGVIWDVGVYPLTLLTAFFGPVKRVLGYSNVLKKDHVTMNGEPFSITTPDYYLAVVELESGVTCRLSANFYAKMSYQGGSIEFHGDDGRLKLGDFQNFHAPVEFGEYAKPYKKVIHNGVGAEKYMEFSRGVQDMAQAIIEGRDLRSSASQAAHVIDTIAAILKSIEKRGFVEVKSKFKAPSAMNYEYKIEE
ncbi:MAG: oxidoreductase [Marinovum sp.]|nr:oxidoreductase [Marinovum sp.]|tara:strand:+ start:6187 stop:7281 length:1095 start_codon:yes stop_codon:yes gene_type:complete